MTLLCNDEILELSSTPVSSEACSHVTTDPGAGEGDDHEEGQDEGPQPWVPADNGGSDIPVAVGIFVATVVGAPVKRDMDTVGIIVNKALVLIPVPVTNLQIQGTVADTLYG